jgi:tetratricopeptide (TPR) repeat protein
MTRIARRREKSAVEGRCLGLPISRAQGEILLVAIVLALTVGVAYAPTLDGQFLSWDDYTYVAGNPNIRGTWRSTCAWAFTTVQGGNWHPLTWLSHKLDYELYGLNPRGHHFTNLVFHIANSVLLFVVLQRLIGALWRSAAVAALFGLHPLHVESVAWVAERKDVLSGFFWLLTIAAYARYARVQTWTSYIVVMITFSMGLLSKPMVITLPLVLLLLDYWPMRRLSWSALWEKLPLFALALTASVWTLEAQRSAGAVGIDLLPLSDRLENASVAYVKYLGLTAWPVGLSPWYSHPALEGAPLSRGVIAGAVALLLTVTVLAVALARRRPYLLVGWFWYLGTLLPVIGLVQIGRQAMADRYTYIPLIGIFLACVWGISDRATAPARTSRTAGAVVGTALLAALAMLTWQQTEIWHDSMTFWSYTARVNPYAFIAHQARGGLLARQGRLNEAIAAYRRAVYLRPTNAEARAQLGNVLAREGRFAAAVAQYRKAIALRPNTPNEVNKLAYDYKNLGDVLLHQGRPAQARRYYARGLALRPNL